MTATSTHLMPTRFRQGVEVHVIFTVQILNSVATCIPDLHREVFIHTCLQLFHPEQRRRTRDAEERLWTSRTHTQDWWSWSIAKTTIGRDGSSPGMDTDWRSGVVLNRESGGQPREAKATSLELLRTSGQDGQRG